MLSTQHSCMVGVRTYLAGLPQEQKGERLAGLDTLLPAL